MRRSEYEISTVAGIVNVIAQCNVMRICMNDGEYPFCVPMNFGYEVAEDKLTFFFHGAKAGRKIKLLKANPKVSFEMDCAHQLVTGDKACAYSYKYTSVMGIGAVTFLEGNTEKAIAINRIMQHVTGMSGFQFTDAELENVEVFKLVSTSYSGKKR